MSQTEQAQMMPNEMITLIFTELFVDCVKKYH